MSGGFDATVLQWVGDTVRVMDAGRRIRIMPQALDEAMRTDTPHVAIDGTYLGFCGTHVYRATGEVSDGCPVYELISGPPGYQGPASEVTSADLRASGHRSAPGAVRDDESASVARDGDGDGRTFEDAMTDLLGHVDELESGDEK